MSSDNKTPITTEATFQIPVKGRPPLQVVAAAKMAKLELEFHKLARWQNNLLQDRCENASVEVSIMDMLRQALFDLAPDHPALKLNAPSYGVWEQLSKRNTEVKAQHLELLNRSKALLHAIPESVLATYPGMQDAFELTRQAVDGLRIPENRDALAMVALEATDAVRRLKANYADCSMAGWVASSLEHALLLSHSNGLYNSEEKKHE